VNIGDVVHDCSAQAVSSGACQVKQASPSVPPLLAPLMPHIFAASADEEAEQLAEAVAASLRLDEAHPESRAGAASAQGPPATAQGSRARARAKAAGYGTYVSARPAQASVVSRSGPARGPDGALVESAWELVSEAPANERRERPVEVRVEAPPPPHPWRTHVCNRDGTARTSIPQLREVSRADIPAEVRCFAFWHASTLPGVHGVVAVEERRHVDTWERFARLLPNGRYAAQDGTRLRRAGPLWEAEELYMAEAMRHKVPAHPRYWLL
jgi:hypothetical protein